MRDSGKEDGRAGREGSLLWRKGEQRPGKERKEQPRAEKFTESCVGGSGEGQAWKRELGTGGRGQQRHWEPVRIPNLQAHAVESQSGRKT